MPDKDHIAGLPPRRSLRAAARDAQAKRADKVVTTRPMPRPQRQAGPGTGAADTQKRNTTRPGSRTTGAAAGNRSRATSGGAAGAGTRARSGNSATPKPGAGGNRGGGAQRGTPNRGRNAGKGGGGGAKRWFKRLGLGLLFAILIGIILGGLTFAIAYWRIQIPDPEKSARAQTTTVYYGDGQTVMGTFASQNRQIIDTSTLPAYVGQSVVASEDRTFFENNGVDIKAMSRALWNNLQGKPTQGGSTLSQQYVERYYTGTNKSYLSKFKETILALKINQTQSKQEILNNYLNTIYYGRGAYGIEAAAQAYFGKPASELTLSEAALLTAVIPAPSALDPAKAPDAAKTRWERVIRRMTEDGWITGAEAKAAQFPATIDRVNRNDFKGTKGYLLEQVRQELESKAGFTQEQIDSLGLSVTTTIDIEKQKQAEEAVANLPEGRPEGLRVALTSIDPKTGGIVAEYGGSDYLEVQRNAATQDNVSGASTFKTFGLIAALEAGHKLSDVISGNSVKVGETTINNYAGIEYGPVTIRRGVVDSINGVFIRLNQEVGPAKTKDVAIRAGIPADTVGLDEALVNVLGTASPHNIDIANAFATYAAEGVYRPAHIIAEVKNRDGDLLYTADKNGKQVFEKEIIAQLDDALTDSAQSYGRGPSLGNRPFAAKTGSGQNNKAAQFAGYTPQLATVVSIYQVGADGNEEEITPWGGVREVLGATYPAAVFGDYMRAALAGTEIEQFPESQTVRETRIQREREAQRQAEEEAQRQAEEEARRLAEEEARKQSQAPAPGGGEPAPGGPSQAPPAPPPGQNQGGQNNPNPGRGNNANQ